MRIFLTEYENDGKSFSGEPIEAISWEEAEMLAKECGLEIIGEYVMSVDKYGNIEVNPSLN